MKIAVSACLIGENCKYNGGNNLNKKLMEFLKDHEVVSICPEIMGGLRAPREPVEIVDGVVRSKDGTSFHKEFRRGAELALELIKREEVDLVILQPRSPSCGVHMIYDGSFSGRLIPGSGILAKKLIEEGIRVIDSEDFHKGQF